MKLLADHLRTMTKVRNRRKADNLTILLFSVALSVSICLHIWNYKRIQELHGRIDNLRQTEQIITKDNESVDKRIIK